MEQLLHFSHGHLLSLVHIHSNHDNGSSNKEEEEKEKEKEKEEEEEDDEDEDEDNDDFVVGDHNYGQCKMCKEQIYSFHMSYYDCKDCDYSLHKFCAEMPTTLQHQQLHPGHNLTLDEKIQLSNYSSDHQWTCGVCNLKRKNFFNYHCSICVMTIDIICATMSQQKMDHPSHPHQLQRNPKQMVSHCNACSYEHQGTFYHCTTCSWFSIHLECALLPSKLLIQQPTNDNFTHSHPLTLAYSFPKVDILAKFHPQCKVCDKGFYVYLWLYKCDKCRYYVHTRCATSKIEPFMSIFLPPGRGKIHKNFQDEDHPNLLHYPFPDESYSLLRHQFCNQDFTVKENNRERASYHISYFITHRHQLILLDKQTSLNNKSWFLHNPMKKVQLLCDGCVKPITTLPFYKCSQDIQRCGFVLHEWCAGLPWDVKGHPGHQDHVLVLVPSILSRSLLGVFKCNICNLPSNGFAYVCRKCKYYVDINCAFLPKEITHEAHPGHLLSRIDVSSNLWKKACNACHNSLQNSCIVFHCHSCDFYLHTDCALSLPRRITHKYDKHPLSLRYNPVENHPSDYYCEICEEKFNPTLWFYHCSSCVQSMHTSCAPLILECEQAVYVKYKRPVFVFVNVKFGGKLKIKGHPHSVALVQGVERHGRCKVCDGELQYNMIFKCSVCEFVLHCKCARSFS